MGQYNDRAFRFGLAFAPWHYQCIAGPENDKRKTIISILFIYSYMTYTLTYFIILQHRTPHSDGTACFQERNRALDEELRVREEKLAEARRQCTIALDIWWMDQ